MSVSNDDMLPTTVSWLDGNTTTEESPSSLPLWTQVSLGLVFGLIGLLNIIGNSLTLISFCRDVKLRTTQNVYILNLAITDLCVGFFSVPTLMSYNINNWIWPFNRTFCKIHLFIDYMVCTESALCIALITYDRYLLVSTGLDYMIKQTKLKAIARIAVTWLMCVLLYSPGILFYDVIKGYSVFDDNTCDAEFVYDFTYVLVTILLDFVPSFSITLILSIMLYYNLYRRAKKIHPAPVSIIKHTISDAGQAAAPATDSEVTQMKRHRKAAKALTIVVLGYGLCWVPYVIVAVVMAFCESCITHNVYLGTVWLLYVNSSINPLLYAFTNPRFKTNFQKLLCCK